ncbi:hypothetical protein Y032_0250g143 [Ancylostoma ceylanicum]|uniref:Uncharacterized protein n=1 Tax=Ancylostoma ceylanicum TaxID=53326 RepID=A0A016SD62_9BILA|nr:hypothetical protein Y032_0250g143 [Ancylostoma ceylanicum]
MCSPDAAAVADSQHTLERTPPLLQGAGDQESVNHQRDERGGPPPLMSCMWPGCAIEITHDKVSRTRMCPLPGMHKHVVYVLG